MVSRAARVGFDELAWLAGACSIDVDELMMAPSPPAIEEEMVNAAEDDYGHFTSFLLKIIL